MMKQLEWTGCYNDSWQGEIVPDAFSHPAKYAKGLIKRIYDHMLEQGYIKPGQTVGDPFGGVALGALFAQLNGLDWRGCELEKKFCTLGNANLELWQKRYSPWLDKWGSASLVQGDSRNFAAIVRGMDGVVSSPPYATDQMGGGGNKHDRVIDAMKEGYGTAPGQLGAMKEGSIDAAISPPPFGSQNAPKGGTGLAAPGAKYIGGGGFGQNHGYQNQAETSGNLAHLKADRADLDSVISSPPYADAVAGQGEGPGARHDPVHHKGDNAHKISSDDEYGRTPGNLGNMAGEGLDAAISSPPFEDSISRDNVTNGRKDYAREIGESNCEHVSPIDMEKIGKRNQSYEVAAGNIGNNNGDTFWTAARQIVEQVYMALKPGGYTAWVCGDFVRKGERVFFGRQWMQLCEAVGFEPVEWIIAWKTETKGTQLDIWGNEHQKKVDRVSFFRRLANEKNPDNAILNEDVIILRKPKSAF